MNNNVKNYNNIDALTIMRFVFISFIFLHHCDLFIAGGSMSVVFFFVLSGFVLYYNFISKQQTTNNKQQTTNNKQQTLSINYYINFLLKRTSKIYPMHLLTFIIWFVCFDRSFSLVLLINILLLQSWIPISGVYFSCNAVSWFLSDTIFFYAMFPFLAYWLNKTSLKNNLYSIVFILSFYFLLTILISSRFSHSLFYINPLFRIVDFILGMFLCKVFVNYKDKFNQYKYYGIILSVAFLMVCIFIFPTDPVEAANSAFMLTSMYWLPMMIFIPSVAMLKIKIHPFLLLLGNASFCFYMIHTIVISIFKHIQVHSFLQYGSAYLVTITVSIILYKYFQIPISKWLNQKITRFQFMTVQ